jgi:hypothetical protein
MDSGETTISILDNINDNYDEDCVVMIMVEEEEENTEVP